MSEMYKRINSLCKEKGTNVTAMCKALNVARSSLSELNRGRTKSLSYDYISKIANYFNVNPDYIAGKTEQKEKPAQNVLVRDENDNIVVLDKETRDLIDSLRSKPEMKMLFSVSKGATKEDIIRTVKIIEALKDKKEGD